MIGEGSLPEAAAVPFTEPQFFAVLAAYNQALGLPVLAGLQALALAAPVLLAGRRGAARRAGAALLAGFWALMGAGYQWAFFAAINPAAWAFGAAFLAQAVLLAWYGAVRDRLRLAPLGPLRAATAGLLGAYALLIYPALALALHPYPATPLPGAAPCPTTILTLAVLLAAGGGVFWRLAAVPLAWSAVGGSAAWLLGVLPDYGLVVAGLAALALGRPRAARAG
ncbi:MAG TPA: DUF6064 family protein [Gammaproteobacteria bacterium]|nr:DUF6064 family protein [Gammaproteobacteria bacterium]